jgi:beta-phosphoglucomutase-like phosphatase (HAD superfamily)
MAGNFSSHFPFCYNIYMIKAVLFDIDGVLIDSFAANLRFYQDLMIKAGYKPPTKEEFGNLFHRTLIDVIKVFTKSTSDDEIMRIYKMGQSREVKTRTILYSQSNIAGADLHTSIFTKLPELIKSLN